jgi:hypothetical protein
LVLVAQRPIVGKGMGLVEDAFMKWLRNVKLLKAE